ncbi:hypothetical protein PVAP13_5KG562000 [Panicum virgatum]|uniref:Uncharacterized protein n=1 Tax=Panicum virgatum TaxID=38727 RepID=A0A8T0SQU7_PANVG|nr:hypothetical protein PVAP13_5KG562000 [Panicum virgatum]
MVLACCFVLAHPWRWLELFACGSGRGRRRAPLLRQARKGATHGRTEEARARCGSKQGLPCSGGVCDAPPDGARDAVAPTRISGHAAASMARRLSFLAAGRLDGGGAAALPRQPWRASLLEI